MSIVSIIRNNSSGLHQCRTSKLDNWGGGAHIHIFVLTDHKNNRFQKKLKTQNTNI